MSPELGAPSQGAGNPDAADAGAKRAQLEAARLRQLRTDLALLQDELQSVYSSPAWRAVLSYRGWLQRMRLRWPRFHALYASLVDRASRRRGQAADAPPLGSWATAHYQEWIDAAEPSAAELDLQKELSAQLAYRPVVSILMPVFRVPLPVLAAAVESVREQTYPHWELCLAHADSADAEARRYLSALAAEDSRIHVRLLESNLGISGNSNAALSMASGEFAGLLDHDDLLAPLALYEVVRVLNEQPGLDFVYSDSDRVDERGARRHQPLFKPDWSPALMLSANYATHFSVLRCAAVRAAGGFRPEMDGAQDWDLFLRVAGDGTRVRHIPKVLYHWREVPASVASGGLAAKPYAAAAQLRTLRSHFAATGRAVEPLFTPGNIVRLRWPDGDSPTVSVVIVSPRYTKRTRNAARRALRAAGSSPLEVVVPVCGKAPGFERGVRFVEAGFSSSVPEMLNQAAQECRGEIVVFLDEQVTVGGDWPTELTGPHLDRKLGAVGAKLIDAKTGRLRHAGIVFNSGGRAQELFSGMEEGSLSFMGLDWWYRDVLAVSGACFSVRRETLLRAGGFAPVPRYPRWDIDLCLRLRLEQGLGSLYNPFARLIQEGPGVLEAGLPGVDEDAGPACFNALFPRGDPFFNPNLLHRRGSIQLRTPQQEDCGPLAPAPVLDFTRTDIAASRNACAAPATGSVERIVWFLPSFSHSFYGGIHTILRFADYFQRAHAVRSTFVLPQTAEEVQVKERIAAAFPHLASSSRITGRRGIMAAPGAESWDAGVATYWTTAFDLLKFHDVRRKFYFVQDDEALFYPAGSSSALVEATYDFGFLGICNSRGVGERYSLRGGSGQHFDPCIDPAVFHAAGRKAVSDRGRTLFCYARPTQARNCFELLMDALRIVKERLGEGVRILTAGANWDPKAYGLERVLENLGLMSYQETAALYRRCDAGLVMMMTCHPSYLPMELMASGALVVSNRNPHTGWLLKDRENCLLAEAGPSAIADAVEEGLKDDQLRARVTRNALDLIRDQYSDWDAQAEKVHQYICSQS